IVSNARELFPEPLKPVITVKVLRGISTLTFLRLCWRAPCTEIRSSIEGVHPYCPILVQRKAEWHPKNELWRRISENCPSAKSSLLRSRWRRRTGVFTGSSRKGCGRIIQRQQRSSKRCRQ